MNKNVLIIMGGALAVALFVGVLVQTALGPKKKGDDESALTRTQILVAAQPINEGTAISSSNVKWQTWPQESLFDGVYQRKDNKQPVDELDIMGKLVRRSIGAGEPVTKKLMVPESKEGANFMAAALGTGMRAASVKISAESSAGGFIRPGDRVDVILTYRVNVPRDSATDVQRLVSRYASETILSNVRILAIDQEAKEANREAKLGKTATLEVDKGGAERLALAAEMGEISLVLRRLGEEDNFITSRKTLTTDVAISDLMRLVFDIRKKNQASSNTVRVYSGSEVGNVSVRTTE